MAAVSGVRRAQGNPRCASVLLDSGHHRQVFRLGPKVVFKTSNPTVEEWRRLLRVHYADGGMFAARCTYLEFLDQRFAPKSKNEESARQAELADCALRG